MDRRVATPMALDSGRPDVEDSRSQLDELSAIKKSIWSFLYECHFRGLQKTRKWLSEISYALSNISISHTHTSMDAKQFETYNKALTDFYNGDYARCADTLRYSTSERGWFLCHYALYKMLPKLHTTGTLSMDFMEMDEATQTEHTAYLKSLDMKINIRMATNKSDGYTYFLKGLVNLKLSNTKDAINMFIRTIHSLPLLVEAWKHLANLAVDNPLLLRIKLPNHWMKEFFLADLYIKLQKNEDAMRQLTELYDSGFSQCHTILSQIAMVYHNKRDVTTAVNIFQRIQIEDPYRLEDLDTYSNLLYVSDLNKELSHLAHHVVTVNKFTAETSCVVGNYFSMRGEHAKAANCFLRAVNLSSNHMFALILQGHEHMELKNTRNAIYSYREVLERNTQDFRAWYGLGQTYEILRMPLFSLYYYKRAQVIKPDDSRMLIALGEVYYKLDKCQEALKCYLRARNVGDVDSYALSRLARLYVDMKMEHEAVASFKQLIKETECTMFAKEHSEAYKYLAYYYLRHNQYNNAFHFAQLCLAFDDTKEEGKALLKEIASKRDLQDDVSRNCIGIGHNTILSIL